MPDPQAAAPLRLISRRAVKAWGEELWLNSTRPEYPAGVSKKKTLAQVLRRKPRLLGSWSRRLFGNDLPVFAKFIRTDFPPIAHIGFSTLVRPQEFYSWICREQDLLAALRRGLRLPDERAFHGFERTYEAWASHRALAGWDAALVRDRSFAKSLRRFSRLDRAELSQLAEDLRRSHQRMARVLNEVDLRQEAGNLLMIKAGLIHALFGLSLQFHPQDPTQEALQEFILAGGGRAVKKLRQARQRLSGTAAPKSEVWMPLPEGKKLRLAEVQQSSDCTYSVADFFTPFVWQKGARFRKGHPALGLTDAALRRHMEGIDFSVTTVSSIRCRPQALDPGAQAKRCRLWKLLDRPALWPFFTVRRLDLGAGGRWTVPAARTFQHLVVLSGRARLESGSRAWRLAPSAPAFVPADLPGSCALAADGPASLLLVGIPDPRGA
jgi:mannose-6-phosphate isomerase class I